MNTLWSGNIFTCILVLLASVYRLHNVIQTIWAVVSKMCVYVIESMLKLKFFWRLQKICVTNTCLVWNTIFPLVDTLPWILYPRTTWLKFYGTWYWWYYDCVLNIHTQLSTSLIWYRLIQKSDDLKQVSFSSLECSIFNEFKLVTLKYG